ncbi:hypothetical protein ACFOWA_13175 [Pedobacter lithocola]|uniref:Uncharacterized protein n=1 Tax=Pedobacter lithocola TaxID=1908239 RepID=A0ABV8PA32_9SPHI
MNQIKTITDLRNIVNDVNCWSEYFDTYLLSKATFMNDDQLRIADEFVRDIFPLFQKSFCNCDSGEEIDNVLKEYFETVKAFVKDCYEFETLSGYKWLSDNLDGKASTKELVINKLRNLKSYYIFEKHFNKELESEFLQTSIALFENMKDCLPKHITQDAKNTTIRKHEVFQHFDDAFLNEDNKETFYNELKAYAPDGKSIFENKSDFKLKKGEGMHLAKIVRSYHDKGFFKKINLIKLRPLFAKRFEIIISYQGFKEGKAISI